MVVISESILDTVVAFGSLTARRERLEEQLDLSALFSFALNWYSLIAIYAVFRLVNIQPIRNQHVVLLASMGVILLTLNIIQ